MNRVFIGFDERETVAYHVLCQSILRHSTEPVSFTPLVLGQLPMTRQREALQSTDFAFSRFLVPWLCDYKGVALFMDCDMLVTGDITDLFNESNDRYAVQVVKHDHVPKETVKFLGQKQTAYPKKNWSSVMLFNNSMCQTLTPKYVNRASGLELHRFEWLHPGLVGEVPREWNYLVGHDDYNEFSNLHYTTGGPWFEDYSGCPHADLWYREKELMLEPCGEAVN